MNGHQESATSARYEAAAIELAHNRLRQCPDQQAEAIGKHYAAHALIALNLLTLCKARRESDDPKELEVAIAHCVEEIKRNHRHDFGLELEWL